MSAGVVVGYIAKGLSPLYYKDGGIKMRLKDTLFLLANGYSKKDIEKMDAEEAEALKAEADAKQAEEAKKKEADDAKNKEDSEKLSAIAKELEEAKKALQDQQKKNINEVNIGSDNVDDTKTMDEFLKTIASYM